MSVTGKRFQISDGWLVISSGGFFTKQRTLIQVKHVSWVRFKQKVIKWLFWMGLVMGIIGLVTTLVLLFSIVGFASLVVSLVAGPKAIKIGTTQGRCFYIKVGQLKEFHEFLMELNFNLES